MCGCFSLLFLVIHSGKPIDIVLNEQTKRRTANLVAFDPKEGDIYLRKLLVQGAHYILGHRGPDTDLKRWGLKLAERGGKNAKKRAIVAVARKLAILLHSLWVSGEVYEPLRNSEAKMVGNQAAA